MHKPHKMQKYSLPSVLCTALKQHVQASDISDDEELQDIMGKLESLNLKIEEVKAKVRANREKSK